MSTTITSPVEGFTGDSHVGSITLEFKDGVAEVDNLSDGVRAYLLSSGYKVGGKSVDQPASLDGNEIAAADAVDSRDLAEPDQFGTKLRDAAVDPEPGDFLAPTNAGKADPHGPEVVSPEVHASQGVRPVKGGEVHVDDVDKQDDLETAHADAATDGTPVEPLPSESTTTEPAEQLKGEALDAALKAAGLTLSGTADEKRARLAEHQA